MLATQDTDLDRSSTRALIYVGVGVSVENSETAQVAGQSRHFRNWDGWKCIGWFRLCMASFYYGICYYVILWDLPRESRVAYLGLHSSQKESGDQGLSSFDNSLHLAWRL